MYSLNYLRVRGCLKRLVVFCLFLGLNGSLFAQGDLLIFPKRLEFEGTKNRVKIVNLHNKGNDTATYHISFREYRMNNTGSFEKIYNPDEGQNFASPFLRFYPRYVTLAPKETQVVKVQLIKTNLLEEGEYRSHLYIRAEPNSTTEKIETGDANEGIAMKLVPVYGFSIASIIRAGDLHVQVEISNLKLDYFQNDPLLNITFIRHGNKSSYGDISVVHISEDGRETNAAEINGFAIYTPGNSRIAKIELNKEDGIDYSSGKLIVRYTSSSGPNKVIYTEENLEL